jgi:hypothetical protein
MKKSALYSAIAAVTMTSLSAHATIHFTTAGIKLPSDITVSCVQPGTYSGGIDGVMTSDASPTLLGGTLCIDPGAPPYVMLHILMADNGTPLLMEQGAIQIATNWGAITGWTPYAVIPVTTANPIACTDLTPPATSACAFTLLGIPATLYLN